jgi:prepilin-type N-terminal cleavage/methylation domain-containing protein
MRTKRSGFSLVELIVVIAIISILLSMLLAAIAAAWRYSKVSAANAQLSIVANGLEQYRLDFGSYPPDNYPTANSSEALAYHLCRKLKKGDMEYGPYLQNITPVDHDGNGYPELWSSLNSPYNYIITLDIKGRERGYISVDSGWDKKLGGTLDPNAGFVSSNNGEDADNMVRK